MIWSEHTRVSVLAVISLIGLSLVVYCAMRMSFPFRRFKEEATKE